MQMRSNNVSLEPISAAIQDVSEQLVGLSDLSDQQELDRDRLVKALEGLDQVVRAFCLSGGSGPASFVPPFIA